MIEWRLITRIEEIHHFVTKGSHPEVGSILDTARRGGYSCLKDHHIASERLFVLVYSITSRSSYHRISNLWEHINRIKNRAPFDAILVGNKRDLENQRQVTINEGHLLAKSLGIPFMEASATDFSASEVLHLICQQVNAKLKR
eukprot:TRINITY_DN1918_c0_g1_i3.p1 TRINITY_DN1918_c0_g1~~TRINITY_DN1918_c0_g1_i3.p1  ORF type:complete len:143 (+),score=17.69 TRINITY_DN1918_c0_g1_i3:454-882(+)